MQEIGINLTPKSTEDNQKEEVAVNKVPEECQVPQ
jgi:hypothetical protein